MTLIKQPSLRAALREPRRVHRGLRQRLIDELVAKM